MSDLKLKMISLHMYHEMKYRGPKMRKFNLLMSALTLTSLMPVFGAGAALEVGYCDGADDGGVRVVIGGRDEAALSPSQEAEDRFQRAYNLLNSFVEAFKELRFRRDADLTPSQGAELKADALSWSERSVEAANAALKKLDTDVYLPFHRRFLELRILDIELANKEFSFAQSDEGKKSYCEAFERKFNLILEIITNDFKVRDVKKLFGAVVHAYSEYELLALDPEASPESKEQNRKDSAEALNQFNEFKNRANLSEDAQYDLRLIESIDSAFAR